MSELTPSQTIGPFFHLALRARTDANEAVFTSAGRRIAVEGLVLDGRGAPVTDALIEVWQADQFDRAPTDGAGRFAIGIRKPGCVPAPDGQTQAPHLVVSVFARGILTRLVTRIYFENEPDNARDPILQLVPADRRGTLIARAVSADRYRFDVTLQGEHETVFFDV